MINLLFGTEHIVPQYLNAYEISTILLFGAVT